MKIQTKIHIGAILVMIGALGLNLTLNLPETKGYDPLFVFVIVFNLIGAIGCEAVSKKLDEDKASRIDE